MRIKYALTGSTAPTANQQGNKEATRANIEEPRDNLKARRTNEPNARQCDPTARQQRTKSEAHLRQSEPNTKQNKAKRGKSPGQIRATGGIIRFHPEHARHHITAVKSSRLGPLALSPRNLGLYESNYGRYRKGTVSTRGMCCIQAPNRTVQALTCMSAFLGGGF